MLKLICTALALSLGLAPCFAAPRPASQNYAVDVWTTEDGLPASSVLSMTQTRDGYLWLGTLYGLVRFDGTRFVIFDESNTPGLNSSKIIRLFEDSRTNLWIGTVAGAILIAEPGGKITRANLSPGRENAGTRLMAITEDSAGAVWIYTADGQLGRYSDKRMDVTTSFADPSNTRTLAADDSGFVWVGTDYLLRGVQVAQTGAAEPSFTHRVDTKVDYTLTSKKGGYWRLVGGRIQKCEGIRVTRDLGRYPWTNSVLVSAACEDKEGNLIVGTYGDPGEGVFWFNEKGEAEKLSGLSHSSILSLLMDRDGTLWVGTDGGGLDRVKRQVFGVVPSSEGLTVQSVSNDRGGGLWIGYNGERIDHWTPAGASYFNITKPEMPLVVRSVFVDAQSNVLAGTFGAGLFRFRLGEFQPESEFDELADPRVWGIYRNGAENFQTGTGGALALRHISTIFQDHAGTLWVGTGSGLAVRREGSWRTFSSHDGLSPGSVQAITEDPAGNLWVGTGTGLSRIAQGTVTIFTRTNGLPSTDISALYADDSGAVWVGTSAGLARYSQGKWISFTTSNGLAGNSIRYVIEDNEGYLWIGSNAGLMRARRQALEAFAEGRSTNLLVRTYGKPDGMPTRECTQGSQPAASKASDGRLWFATTKGVATVDPAHIIQNTNPPPVVIEAVFIDGQRQGTNTLRGRPPRQITVPAGREAIDIHFTALNLAAPQNSRFRYRLAGHESSWTEGTGNHGVAHHTRVPSGDYKFEVQAANEDEVWNTTGATISFTVLPPFWQTWWFVSLSSLAGLGIVVGIVHYLSTQKLHRQVAVLRQQEAIERERARIARDLHDQLGANLTQVALLGEMAEADKDLPGEIEGHARQICQTARDTTRSLDEIVWTINPANDTLDGLVNYTCKYAQEYFALAGLSYRIEVPPDLPSVPVSPEVRHNVFLAAKEAINNVVKHAQASSAWLRLRLDDAHFTLEIQDNGRGLPVGAEQKRRNGLRNMRARLQDVGGSFVASQAPGGGTVVSLTAPLPRTVAANGAT